MASRWLNLLLGVVLLQGALSFGPIDETDEEWIEYRNLMRNGDYRLSTNTRPTSYQVHLRPYLANGENQFTFDGEVTITIEPQVANLNQIRLHCNNLTIESVHVASSLASNIDIVTPGQNFICDEYSTFRINTTPFLALNQQYIVRITFKGYLQTNMRGFYRSWYMDDTGTRRWMATTQFQPGHARQAFPCYDEPRFKATFDISITRDTEGFSPTISNMPIKSSEIINGTTRENFHTTPISSTYLLAFIVSGYIQVATNNDSSRPFHIYARENIGNSGEYSLAIGVPLLDVMERYTNFTYYTMAEHMNMKQAAIPDFSAGAMENWGLLTYREALILYDPENTNNFYKQRIANIISHEIAHMWFGNLVTCAWWDNLWLNEGFARFYQYYLTDIVSPEMGFPTRFITEQVQVSLLSDAATSAHSLTDPSVTDPQGVSAHFSQITYGKGASILRMTQHLLGNSTYVKGLRNYLDEKKFSTAEPSDLFRALDAAAEEDDSLSVYGVTIDQYFRSWSEKPGHPLLNVTVNHATGMMTVQQSRFFRDTEDEQDVSSVLWDIPITWTCDESSDFEDLKPSYIMRTKQVNIDRGHAGKQLWVIFNKQQSGFYRVTYDDITWALITRALRGSDRERIHELNRAQIVDDVFLLARSNRMTYTQAFNILSFLRFEDQYAPWLAAITGFNYALRSLAHDNLALNRLRTEILDLSTAVVARLGYNEPENGGTFMDDLLRMHVMTFLCNVGHPGCITAALTSFQTWRNGGRIPPNMRPWVYCNGLRYGSPQDFDFFWNRYLVTNLANEQVVMITAAGCTQDQPSLNRFLTSIVSGSNDNTIVRAQDFSTAISSAVTSNEYNTMRAFQWLQDNLQRVIATPGVLNTMLTSITNRLLTDTEITAMGLWLTENEASIEASAVAAAKTGIENSDRNLRFYRKRVDEFNKYFDEGFNDILEPTTTTTDPTTTTTDPTTATTDPTTTTTDPTTITTDPTTTTTDPTTTTTDPTTITTDPTTTTTDPTTTTTDPTTTTTDTTTTITDPTTTTTEPTTTTTDPTTTSTDPTTTTTDPTTTTTDPTTTTTDPTTITTDPTTTTTDPTTTTTDPTTTTTDPTTITTDPTTITTDPTTTTTDPTTITTDPTTTTTDPTTTTTDPTTTTTDPTTTTTDPTTTTTDPTTTTTDPTTTTTDPTTTTTEPTTTTTDPTTTTTDPTTTATDPTTTTTDPTTITTDPTTTTTDPTTTTTDLTTTTTDPTTTTTDPTTTTTEPTTTTTDPTTTTTDSTTTEPEPTTPTTEPEPTTPTTEPTTTTTEPTTTTTDPTTTITEPTTTTTAAPTTTAEPTTTPDPDSANIATLSVVTLIVTLVINMA